MSKPKSIRVYEQLLTVQISDVPYDMMRYDNAVPATEEEAHKLYRVAHGVGKPEDRTVIFRRFSRNTDGPTTGRWESFNCKVLAWKST